MMSNQNMILDRAALFTDETDNFRIPAEPAEFDQVVLKFRTGKDNVDQVYLIKDNNEYEMKKSYSDTWFDYYTIHFRVETEKVHYHFEVVKGTEHCSYNKLGAGSDNDIAYSFCITPGFKTPDWAKGAVMYQIFVDRFCNGDPTNDPVDQEYFYINNGIRKIDDWYQYPAAMDVGNFYGGDLQGVWDKLDYLKFLGVDAIYMNPIFVSPSSHKYDIQDYDYIDPHFGVIVKDGGEPLPEGCNDNSKATKYISRVVNKENLEASNAFFAKFVEAVHKRGMKVILDGVFNHCGSFNKWLDRERIYESDSDYDFGAYVSDQSPYREYFSFYQDKWPYNAAYDGWWGHDTLPKLNYEDSDKLYDTIMRIGAKWVSPPYNVDGWRLDVAADLGRSVKFNHKFWQDFRNVVKQANPQALILAEHYGDAGPWLHGDQWDTVMNYDAFMEPVTWFLTGMEKHSDERNDHLYGNAEAFFRTMTYQGAKMHSQSLQVAMNELSNHDHSRFLTRTNRTVGRIGTLGPEAADKGVDKSVLALAVMIQMTWPGAPTIYYGDEVGMCGWTDPDNRRCYPWGREDLEMLEYNRYLIIMHKNSKALKIGSVKPLLAEEHLIAYGRFYGDDIKVVIINSKPEARDVRIPVWTLGIGANERLVRIMLTNDKKYNIGQVKYTCDNGYLSLRVDPVASVLLSREN